MKNKFLAFIIKVNVILLLCFVAHFTIIYL